MNDAGKVAPKNRRYGNDSVIECYKNLVAWAKTAEEVGIDTMWLTEHHFQYEGYEVLPNLILFGQHLTSVTKNLRLGQMFNVVPQWHPLRLAEDFAIADIVTGGRMEFGVGRGTVPREAWSLGTVVASGDNAMSAEHDRINREVFEESMEVIKLAWYNERFSYRGKHFVFPPDEIPDRGSYVDDLTLIPKPLRHIDVYQPVTSPETIEYVPRVGHKAIYW
ncbi:MAG: LLM class flavin-dependent oxidoreductase, partial [Acidimicrobiaceae bacterium]